MDTQRNTAVADGSQGPAHLVSGPDSKVRPPHQSPADRRLLLISMLRLFLGRLRHGIAIRRTDLLRLLDFADSDVEVL